MLNIFFVFLGIVGCRYICNKNIAMAINFVTQIDDVMFSSALRTLEISAGEETAVTFTIMQGEQVLFANTYTPATAGTVKVYDINKILEDHIPESHAIFSFVVADDTKECVVIRANTLVDIGAKEFIDNYFLSPCLTVRNTSRYRKECLSLLSLSADAVTVEAEATYYKDGLFSTAEIQLQDVTGFATIDVSPSLFINPSRGKLVYYTVKAGSRLKRYEIVNHIPDAVGVIYRNSFNAWDTFYFTGLLASEIEHKRTNAVVGGRLIAYDVEEIKKFKANTGPIRYGCESLPEELCRSLSTFLIDLEGNSGDEIVITEAELKNDNAPDTIADFVVTYRLADTITSIIRTPHKINIFDSSFDETFE